MTKKDLIKAISDDCDIPKTQVERVLDSLGSMAGAELHGGGEVPLPGLGKLKAEERKARAGINPATKAPITIPARTVVKFSAGQQLKDALQG